jgi:hypothetical protein
LTKEPKTCIEENTTSSTNDAGRTVGATCRKLKLDPNLSPCTSLNSEWIKDLNVRSEFVKLLQEIMGNTLEHVDKANNFMNRTIITQQLKRKD